MNVVEGDAVETLPQIASSLPPKTPWKLAGNIPYYITGKLLRVISELKDKPELSVLMIQREVAERMCAAPPRMNRLAASVQFWADANMVAVVPKSDFSPPPEVDSAVVILKTKVPAAIDQEQYYKTVRAVFSQPRKKISNNLMGAVNPKGKGAIEAILKKLGIDPGLRPQNLTTRDIEGIADSILWG